MFLTYVFDFKGYVWKFIRHFEKEINFQTADLDHVLSDWDFDMVDYLSQ